MKFLALVLLLAVFVSPSHSQCFVKLLTPEMELWTHCQDSVDKTWHPMGSKWRNSQCMDCTCHQCCYGYITPTNYPADCVAVFDREACRYNVHKKDDPTVECEVTGALGK